jgi:hypothetical protein
MRAAGIATLTFLLALGIAARPVGAQSATALAVSLSADTIPMGELFDLRVGISVPPNSVVYFPDTLAATVNVESADPVRTEAEAEASSDGGARLTLTYPMMAFGVGTLPVPGFDVMIVPRGTGAEGGALPGGSVIGAWSDAPSRIGPALTRIPRQAVWVVPVFTPQDLVTGIEPRPPNDVFGGAWHWPSLALLLVFSSGLAVTLVSTTRDWLAHSDAGVAHEDPTLEVLRQRALGRLDDLLDEGLHAEGQLLEFYTQSTGIVRSYVEAMDAEWASSLTSSELIGRLLTRSGEDAAGHLPQELGTAEVVKFGRLEPGREGAETHWRALKDWVEGSGARTW